MVVAPMRAHYSAWNLLAASRRGHRDWAPAWRDAEPKPRYDIVIVGGGGHGLATAYYLAKNHGITNVCVLEAGWIGGGNTGRNTTIVRSNYLYPRECEAVRLFGASSMSSWLGRAQLQHHVQPARRPDPGALEARHGRTERDGPTRCCCNGIDAELLDAEAGARTRTPVELQSPRRAIPSWADSSSAAPVRPVRHDAVAWGYARARLGAGRGHRAELRRRGLRQTEASA